MGVYFPSLDFYKEIVFQWLNSLWNFMGWLFTPISNPFWNRAFDGATPFEVILGGSLVFYCSFVIVKWVLDIVL